MASVGPAARNTPKKPRACVPCHNRKVKCDVEETGLPCTRCLGSNRDDACQFVPRPARIGPREKKRRCITVDDSVDQPQPPEAHIGSSGQSRPARKRSKKDAAPKSDVPLPDLSDVGHVERQHGGRVAEEDSQLETALQLAQTIESDSRVSTPDAQEVYAYHAGIDSTTILGQVLNPESPSKLVRVRVRSPHRDGERFENDLSTSSTAYLHSIGALDVTQPTTCQKMVHLYFERVHPYIPLLHRVAFSKKLSKGTASTFLLQCIFTSVAPYMSTQLLTESGHSNRATAQKSFFTKAQALYDMSTEISQLHRLQGSLILTSSYFSFGLDKDCRFWLYNAVRIALQVGIHRKQILSQLNSEAARLFQKMFWILYSRDIVMVMAGRLNVRALDDRYCDVPPLTEDDWEEESEDERVCYGLSPISTVHRLYIVHSSKLDRICARYIELFKQPGVAPMPVVCKDLDNDITNWRRSLPPQLQPETVDSWSLENVWILVLRILVCRLQCHLFKNIRLLATPEQDDCKRRALARQRNSMLEMDSTVRCIVLNDLVEFCPFSVATCISTLVAMHFECALNPSSSEAQQRIHHASIQSGIAFLRQCAEHWDSVKWSLRMFEAISTKLKLPLDAPAFQGSQSMPRMKTSPVIRGQAANVNDPTATGDHSMNTNIDAQNIAPTWAPTPAHTTLSSIESGLFEDQFPLDFGLSGDFEEFSLDGLFDSNPIPTWTFESVDF